MKEDTNTKDYQPINEWMKKRRFSKFSNILENLLIIIVIGLIAGLAGMQSEPINYALNKPLGLGYAHFASYFEAGLVGAFLYNYMFRSKK